MRIVGVFLQSLAIGIILLHSIIPHHHHSELSESDHISQHKDAISFLDLIALGFHSDHQDGHLKDFTTSIDTNVNGMDFVPYIAILHAAHFPFLIEQKSVTHPSPEAPFFQGFYAEAVGLRGPPSLG